MYPSRGFVDPIGRKDPPAEIKNLSMQSAAKTLLETEEFVVIDESTAASAPANVVAYRMVELGSGKYAAGYHLLRKGTTAGKLYGLCCLYMASSKDLKKFADELISNGGEVTVVEDGKQSRQPVKQVVERIVSGEYPRRLGRLYGLKRITTKASSQP